MEFLYIFTVIFISTFGLAALLYFLWKGFSHHRNENSVVIIPVYEEQSDISQLIELLERSGVKSVILMDFDATAEQKRICKDITERKMNVYCCKLDELTGS